MNALVTRPQFGIALIILSTLVFALQDGVSRYLGSHYSIITIVAIRFWVFAAVAIGLSMASEGGIRRVARSTVPWMQVARVGLLIVQIWLTIAGFVSLGLIPAHAIFAINPLLVAALAWPILGEAVDWRRGAAIFAGMMGMLVILRPGFQVFDPAAIFPLAGALLFALYSLLTRRVARHDDAATTFFYTGVGGAILSTVALPFFWTPIIGIVDYLLIAALCALAILGHFLHIRAYAMAEASVLQPFSYFQLIFIVALGLMLFGESLDGWTIAGAGLIVLAGLYTLRNPAAMSRRSEDAAGGR
ncbi:DMT family transporter [Pseudogemmobacter sonorensis]|uniref:DMT family transporter n=1 Tax=Pseudogemmobacter sonorensis TaxID=2989681 RepID=UPI00368C45A8